MGHSERVDADDVGMSVDLRDRLALALQARDEVRVGALGERLDRVARARLHVLGEEDDAHAARSELALELEVADPQPRLPGERRPARGVRGVRLVDHRASSVHS